MQEINKFDGKLNVIPNGLETYMTFTINNNLLYWQHAIYEHLSEKIGEKSVR